MSNRKLLFSFIAIMAIIIAACSTDTDKWKELNEQYLRVNASKPGVITTKDGLQYKVLVQGVGLKPNVVSRVALYYTGRLIDGTVFDSTLDSTYINQPLDSLSYFSVSGFVSGFTEALLKMNTGSKFELYIPQSLGYGSTDMGTIPPYSTLIFDVQLINVQ